MRSDLLDGRIRPGDRVTEEWAAGFYAASRTPVREACRRLAEDGLLAYLPRRGYRVPLVDRDEIDHLYEIRRVLEVFAVRRIAGQAGDVAAILEELRSEWSSGTLAPGSDVVYKDEDFHRALAMASGNDQIVGMLDPINARIRLVRVHDFLDRERVHQTCVQHVGILDAIAAGDADLAGALMHAHISESQRAVVAAAREAADVMAGDQPLQ